MNTEIIYNGGMYNIKVDGIWVDTAHTQHDAEVLLGTIQEAQASWAMGGANLDTIHNDLARMEDEQCDQDFAQPQADDDATLPGCDALYCTNPTTHTIDNHGSIYYFCCKHFPDIAGTSCDCEAELAAIHNETTIDIEGLHVVAPWAVPEQPLLAQCAALLDALMGGPIIGGGILDELRRVRAALAEQGW